MSRSGKNAEIQWPDSSNLTGRVTKILGEVMGIEGSQEFFSAIKGGTAELSSASKPDRGNMLWVYNLCASATLVLGKISHGKLQQYIGTEFKRPFGNDVWAKRLLATAQKVIITDVRFRVEADAILAMGGVLIRLEGDPAGVRKTSTRDPTHVSEVELDDYERFTHVVDNDIPDMKNLCSALSRIFPLEKTD
jgi:hypothetical protein